MIAHMNKLTNEEKVRVIACLLASTEGFTQVSDKIGQLKLPGPDGKMYDTDCGTTHYTSQTRQEEGGEVRFMIGAAIYATLFALNIYFGVFNIQLAVASWIGLFAILITIDDGRPK